jgi:multicomponent Na+:H+ antiporter subunit F
MEYFFVAVGIFLLLLVFLCLYRCIKGPTIFDRIIAVGAIGTQVMVLLVVIGFIYKRENMFIDLAMAYALLNFVGTVVIAKYFLKTREKEILQ